MPWPHLAIVMIHMSSQNPAHTIGSLSGFQGGVGVLIGGSFVGRLRGAVNIHHGS